MCSTLRRSGPISALLLALLILSSGCADPNANDAADNKPGAEALRSPAEQQASPAGQQPSPQAVAVEAAKISDEPLGLLLTAEELRSRLEDDNLRIIDVRPLEQYKEAHIPGAVWVDLNDWKSLALSDGGLHNAAEWASRVGRLGIDSSSNVVVYSENPTDTTRIWWTLKYLGVERAAVLDGGWSLWKKSNGPVSDKTVTVAPSEFEPNFQTQRVAVVDDLRTSYDNEDVIVVDARSAEEFAGAEESARTGHIPGAVHLEWKELLDAEGRYKSPAELRVLFQERGIAPDQTAITHCQTGGRASLNAFAFELAGYPKVQNYYCGWSEWSKDPDLPVVKKDDE